MKAKSKRKVKAIHRNKVIKARKVLKPEDDYNRLSAMFQLLSDPTKLRILHSLSAGEMCVSDIANLLNATESAVSHQLRLLRAYAVVKARREGRIIHYSLDDEHILSIINDSFAHLEEGKF